MFTGLIQDIGTVAFIDKQGDWVLAVETDKLPLDKTAIGASISCNGICLTVIERTAKQFKVQVSMETLSKTTALHWRTGSKINLEPALRAGDELGGHIVSGHIDGLARVIDKEASADSIRFRFEVSLAFAKYIAPKGSVTLDGVSLTINDVAGNKPGTNAIGFGVNIIPHTQNATTLGALKIGDDVNFEIDTIARYVERMMISENIK